MSSLWEPQSMLGYFNLKCKNWTESFTWHQCEVWLRPTYRWRRKCVHTRLCCEDFFFVSVFWFALNLNIRRRSTRLDRLGVFVFGEKRCRVLYGIFVSNGGRQLMASICHAVRLITRLKTKIRLSPSDLPPQRTIAPLHTYTHTHTQI